VFVASTFWETVAFAELTIDDFALPKRGWYQDQAILWPLLAACVVLGIWLRARDWKKYQSAKMLEEQCDEIEEELVEEEVEFEEELDERDEEEHEPESRDGFTLVELLVVVAIISLLASIGVTNYQAAVIKAKVVATQSNMRVIEEAIIQYRNDFGNYPAFARARPGHVNENVIGGMVRRLSVLTTPIKYITSIPLDPFPVTKTSDGSSLSFFDTYDYADSDSMLVFPQTREVIGGNTSGSKWRLASPGPDCIQAFGGIVATGGMKSVSNPLGVDYDPTNGIISFGDIVRVSQEPEKRGTLPGIQRVPTYIEHFRNYD